MPRPLSSKFEAETKKLLNSMHERLFTSARNPIRKPYKTLEDPFTKMVTVKCCKEEPEIPAAVFALIKENHYNDSIHSFVWQSLQYLKHPHINPLEVNLGSLLRRVPGTCCYFCPECENLCPFSTPLTWFHQCQKNEWAWVTPNQNPTMRWHPAAQCWIFKYGYHNRIEEYLQSKPQDCSWDEKNSLWLIADKISSTAAAVIKQWTPDFIWLQNTKKAAPATRQISQTALHAETILTFLPQEELKGLIRKTFMKLHPDRGGNHDDFVKFKLALEAWEKKGETR